MIIRKAYKYRIYPNKAQRESLAVQFGHARFVYNYFLAERQRVYEETGKGVGYNQTANALTKLKKEEEFEWLRGADAQVLQQSLKALQDAYERFFKKQNGYPRFKSRRLKQSIRYPQRFKFEGNRTYLPKVGWVKTVFHRPMEGKAKNVTVSKTKSGKYFAAIQCEIEVPEPDFLGDVVGIDLGLKQFAVLSDGQFISKPKHFILSEKRLKRHQRNLSRKQRGSKGREKARIKVARLHEKVSNQRKDFHHKLSRELTEKYCLIGVEDLNVAGMVRNHRLAKHISDAGWSEFVWQLEYKGSWYGCHIEKINRFFPSSKTCSNCGYVKDALTLKDRVFECLNCESVLDRDLNASRNVLKQTTVGTTGNDADGVHVRPVV